MSDGGTVFADESTFTYLYNSAIYPISATETNTLDSGEAEIYTVQYIYE